MWNRAQHRLRELQMSHDLTHSSLSVNEVCTECGSNIHWPHRAPKKVPSPIAKKPRKPRKTPSILFVKEARRDIKVEMIALVPEVSRAKAAAIVDTYERSMARLIGASSTDLSRVVCKGRPIGQELGIAIWRALH